MVANKEGLKSELLIETSRGRSELQLLRHLPSELWPAEVTIAGCALVNRPLQVQFPGEGQDNITYTGGTGTPAHTSQLLYPMDTF